MVDGLGHRDLFGGHVAERSDHPSVIRSAHDRPGAEERGQAEIHQPHPSARVDQHVLGLDVPVDDPGVVGMLEGLGDLRHEVEGIALGDRAVGQELPQAGPLDVFHHQAKEVTRLADVEHRRDERVPQLRERSRLAQEPVLECVIGLEVGPDDLDGDEPVQERLTALVDDPHPAMPQQLHHLQIGEARGQLRGRGQHEPGWRKEGRLLAPGRRGIRLGICHGARSSPSSGHSWVLVPHDPRLDILALSWQDVLSGFRTRLRASVGSTDAPSRVYSRLDTRL